MVPHKYDGEVPVLWGSGLGKILRIHGLSSELVTKGGVSSVTL